MNKQTKRHAKTTLDEKSGTDRIKNGKDLLNFLV